MTAEFVGLTPETLSRLIERRGQPLVDALLLEILHTLLRSERHLMSAIDDATASVAAKVTTLTSKVDAALAALQASASNGTPVTQAEIDAITAIGSAADAESAKVDAALNPAAPAA